VTEKTAHDGLLAAVNQYLEMMYDGDLNRFDTVFAPTAQLHGISGEQVRMLPAAEYRRLLSSRPSPKSKNAPRQQEILLIDVAASTQALVKVRVRIDDVLFVDYLSYHLIGASWLVTAKSFHIERRFESEGQ
jgi:putative lumazine-binding protein